MSRRNKKRTKRYHGEDAATPVPSEPVVHRYQAVDRGRAGQWWFEKQKTVKLVSKIAGGGIILVWLLYELIRIVT